MTQNRTLSSVAPLILAGGIALLGCILIGGTLFFVLRPQSSQAAETPVVTRVRTFPTATMLPSATPSPTSTSTPAPSSTPSSTNTAVPPTAAPVTKAPPASAPTNTAVPPTVAAAAPGAAHGLRVDYFKLEQTAFASGADIWFNFMVTNISTERVGWGYLGAYFADMNGTKIFYQPSYAAGVGGDPKYWLQPAGQLPWRDHWKNTITTPGTYQAQLRICYNTMGECDGGAGWENLSPFIQFTIG